MADELTLKQIDAIIQKHYPKGGSVTCAPLIPQKTAKQVSRRAAQMGVAVLPGYKGRFRKARTIWVTNGWDDIIRKHYPQEGAAGCMAVIPRSRQSISSRARNIGVPMDPVAKKRLLAGRFREALAERKEEERKLTSDKFGDKMLPLQKLFICGRR